MAPRAVTFGCAGPRLSTDEARLFAQAQPWGFILFARNVEGPEQLSALVSELRDAVGRTAPVLIDQEGGRVDRLGSTYWSPFPPPLDQMAQVAPEHRTRAMYLRGRLIAADLAALGIDVNCVPLGDIASGATHHILRNRCYGSDAETVTSAARAVADGTLDGGVLPVLKHMPGHGRAVVDSHLELPRTDAHEADLAAQDFAVFRALSDLPMGMTAHVVYAALDDQLAGTLSPTMHRIIREDIGFGGLLMTDDLSMEALSGTVTERALGALAAGCDIALHCNGKMADMSALAEVAPPMSLEAKARWRRAQETRRAPLDVDLPALRAEFDGYLAP